jgi:CHAT domain-containing protein
MDCKLIPLGPLQTIAILGLASVSLAQTASANRPDQAKQLLNAAEVALSSGKYESAMDDASEAARLFAAQGDQSSQGDALNVLGRAYSYRGHQESALGAFQRALQAARQTHDLNGEIGRLNNIGSIYFFQGRYFEALTSYEQALERVRRTAREPWNPRRRVLTLVNLAVLYEQLGQDNRALDLYNEARRDPSALPASEQAQLLSNVGTLYRRLGDPGKALSSYLEAERLFKQEKHADAEIHVLHNIGIARAQDLADLKGALAAFTRALARSERISNDPQTTLGYLFRGETYLRMGYHPEARADFERAASLAERTGASEEHWTALYGLGRIQQANGERAAALASFRRAIAEIESLRSQLTSPTLKSEFLASKRDVYDASTALLLEQPQPPLEEAFDLIERARARNFKETLPVEHARTSLRQLQSRLDGSTVLLEYWLAKDRAATLWITRSGAGLASHAMNAADLEAITALGKFPAADMERSWPDLSLRAGQALLSGIEALHDPRMKKVVIVPDGALQFLPFEILKASSSQPSLLERFTTWYVPSAAAVTSPRKQSWFPHFPWERQLAAFGDPLVPDASAKLPSDEQWDRLRYSGDEVRQIARLLPGASELHLSAANTKRNLLQPGHARPPILHISTHAAVDLADPDRSRIFFTPENERGSGYLFRREVQKLKLAGLDLVTLSACETERGRLVRGEGVQSFSRAFLGAGAAATVTTLWRVADQPTAEFMKQFYFQLAKGQTKAEALRAAKLKFLRSNTPLAEPGYWASFVLNGDGDAALPHYLPWSIVTGVGASLAIVGLVWIGYINSRRQR